MNLINNDLLLFKINQFETFVKISSKNIEIVKSYGILKISLYLRVFHAFYAKISKKWLFNTKLDTILNFYKKNVQNSLNIRVYDIN